MSFRRSVNCFYSFKHACQKSAYGVFKCTIGVFIELFYFKKSATKVYRILVLCQKVWEKFYCTQTWRMIWCTEKVWSEELEALPHEDVFLVAKQKMTLCVVIVEYESERMASFYMWTAASSLKNKRFIWILSSLSTQSKPVHYDIHKRKRFWPQ